MRPEINKVAKYLNSKVQKETSFDDFVAIFKACTELDDISKNEVIQLMKEFDLRGFQWKSPEIKQLTALAMIVSKHGSVNEVISELSKHDPELLDNVNAVLKPNNQVKSSNASSGTLTTTSCPLPLPSSPISICGRARSSTADTNSSGSGAIVTVGQTVKKIALTKPLVTQIGGF